MTQTTEGGESCPDIPTPDEILPWRTTMDKVPTPEEIQEAFPREVDEATDLVLDQIFNIMRKSWTTEVRLNFQHVSRRVEGKLRAELTEKGWDVQVERTAEQRLGFFTLASTTVVTVKPAAAGGDDDDQ